MINACHSEKMGEIFRDYVDNVIAINESVAIGDAAALKFAVQLYKELIGEK